MISFFFFTFSCESTSKPDKSNTKIDALNVTQSADSTSTIIAKKTTKDFVPKGYFLQKEIFGDLNGDKKADCVLILEKKDGKSEPRAVRILLHNKKEGWIHFKTNWDLIGAEYADEYIINEKEDYKIQDGQLILETFCYGPCGNTFFHFAFEKNEFIVTYYSYYFAGAGSHSFTEYSRKDRKITNSVTNTMLEEMPTETEETRFEKRILFQSVNWEGLFEQF